MQTLTQLLLSSNFTSSGTNPINRVIGRLRFQDAINFSTNLTFIAPALPPICSTDLQFQKTVELSKLYRSSGIVILEIVQLWDAEWRVRGLKIYESWLIWASSSFVFEIPLPYMKALLWARTHVVGDKNIAQFRPTIWNSSIWLKLIFSCVNLETGHSGSVWKWGFRQVRNHWGMGSNELRFWRMKLWLKVNWKSTMEIPGRSVSFR